MSRLPYNVKSNIISFLYHRFDAYNKPERTWDSIAEEIKAEFKVSLTPDHLRSLMGMAANIEYLGKTRKVAVRKPVRTVKPKVKKPESKTEATAIAGMTVSKIVISEEVAQAIMQIRDYIVSTKTPLNEIHSDTVRGQ